MSTAELTEAGRELDQAVAIEVMGWGWMTSDPAHTQVLPFKRWLVPPDQFGDWGHVHPADLSLPMEEPWWLGTEKRFGDCEIVPAYSTDIAAAWSVVEAMRARGIYIDVGTRHDGFSAYAGFAGPDGGDIWESTGTVRADTAPLAICRAALASIATAPVAS